MVTALGESEVTACLRVTLHPSSLLASVPLTVGTPTGAAVEVAAMPGERNWATSAASLHSRSRSARTGPDQQEGATAAGHEPRLAQQPSGC